MSRHISHIFLFTLFILTSCSAKMDYEELMAYIQEPKNGVVQYKVVNATELKISYKPNVLIAYQECKNRGLSKENYDSIMAGLESYEYFVLSVSKNKKDYLTTLSNKHELTYLLDQLAFGLNAHAFITNELNDTLSVIDSQISRLFGHGESTDVLMVFPNNKIPGEEVIFHLAEFGLRVGKLKFRFDKRKLNEIRNVTLNTSDL